MAQIVCGRGSGLDRFRLELEDWVRSGTNRLELEDWARSGTNRLQLDDWDFWVVCDFSPQKNPTWTGLAWGMLGLKSKAGRHLHGLAVFKIDGVVG